MLKGANKGTVNQLDIQSITYLDEKVNEEESLEDIGENEEGDLSHQHNEKSEADLSRE